MIDKLNKEQKVPFKTEFTDDRVTDAVDFVVPEDLESLKKKLESFKRKVKEKGITESERQDIEKRKKEVEKRFEEFEKKVADFKKEIGKKKGGCYPASATFVDVTGRRRQMESLLLGEEVQVITDKGVTSKPVITFIHRQPDLFQKFLQITTLRYKKILKITEDHLIFVEKNGKEAAIPARDVKIGDVVYVKVGGKEMLEKDAVQGVSIVFEKGVYASVAPFWSTMSTPPATLMCCLMFGFTELWELRAQCITCHLRWWNGSAVSAKRMDSQDGVDWHINYCLLGMIHLNPFQPLRTQKCETMSCSGL